MARRNTSSHTTHPAKELGAMLRIQLMAFGVGFAAAGALLVLITA